MARGFGISNGGGSTDRIRVDPNSGNDFKTYAAKFWMASASVNGRVWDQPGGSFLLIHSSSANLRFAINYTGGTQAGWSFSCGTGFHQVVVRYTPNSFSSPDIWLDGSKVTLTVEQAQSAATGENPSGGTDIGNRAAQDRVWPGHIYEYALWHEFLSDEACLELSSGLSPMAYVAKNLVAYLPMRGGVNPPINVASGVAASARTGTLTGKSEVWGGRHMWPYCA